MLQFEKFSIEDSKVNKVNEVWYRTVRYVTCTVPYYCTSKHYRTGTVPYRTIRYRTAELHNMHNLASVCT